MYCSISPINLLLYLLDSQSTYPNFQGFYARCLCAFPVMSALQFMTPSLAHESPSCAVLSYLLYLHNLAAFLLLSGPARSFSKHIYFIICHRYPLEFYDTCLFQIPQKLLFYFHLTCSLTNTPISINIYCHVMVNASQHR